MMTPDALAAFFAPIADHLSGDPNNSEHQRAWTIAFFAEQARGENTNASNNPLACELVLPGSTYFNDAGVQNYATMADGIKATIAELDPASYYTEYTDWYPNVRLACKLASIDSADRSLVAAQIRKWGTTDFALEIEQGWNPTVSEQDTNPPASEAELQALNSAALARLAVLAEGADAMLAEYTRSGDTHLAISQFVIAAHRAANPEEVPTG